MLREPMTRREILNVFSIGVVTLVRRPIPDHAQSQGPAGTLARSEAPKEAELQEVSEVAGVAVLHSDRMPDL